MAKYVGLLPCDEKIASTHKNILKKFNIAVGITIKDIKDILINYKDTTTQVQRERDRKKNICWGHQKKFFRKSQWAYERYTE